MAIFFKFNDILYCEDWMLEFDESFQDHNSLEIPLGVSRLGGPIFDYPTNFSFPKDSSCLAQINLADLQMQVSEIRLPKTGYLYFFIGQEIDSGMVIHCEGIDNLTRVKNGSGFPGRIIEGFTLKEDKVDSSDSFKSMCQSKMFGEIYHCQWSEEEIKESNISNYLLLQIGEDITPEGAMNTLISQTDMKDLNFNNCQFNWAQT